MLDRYKPGVIAVNGRGQRFVNEADSYHAFGEAMQAGGSENSNVPAFLICDSRFMRKYGLGLVRPGASGLRRLLDEGYLAGGKTIRQLAQHVEINASNLDATVKRYNEFAARGEDPDFGKGSNAYNRYLGDPDHKPNPCLAPIEIGPFYGVKVFPGDLGTSCGVETNANAQVLRADATVIEGLYACGNDMNSIMIGRYPGPGATLGPGLTFGYAAAMHMADRAAITISPETRRDSLKSRA